MSSAYPSRPIFIPLPNTNSGGKYSSLPNTDYTGVGGPYHESPLPTGTTATFSINDDQPHLSTPTPALLLKKRRPHPFAPRHFESPEWTAIAVHFVWCALTYPFLYACTLLAQKQTLTLARAIIGFGCTVVGLCVGPSLMDLGRRFLEAATWATLIHQSYGSNAPGVKLKSFSSRVQEPNYTSAILLLKDRIRYRGTARRQRLYDARPWSVVIILFLTILTVSSAIGFGLDRCVNIDTLLQHQHTIYDEVTVRGELSDEDIQRGSAFASVFNNFALTWTLQPFRSLGSLPAAIRFTFDDDTVYLSEPLRSQFEENGSGLGTFLVNYTDPQSLDPSRLDNAAAELSKPIEAGQILRFPKWGIRIHCEKLPDVDVNIIPKSTANNLTYVMTPRSTLEKLFKTFNRELPVNFTKPFDVAAALRPGDILPANVKTSEIALLGAFFDNGVAHSFKSDPVGMGEDGTGFVQVETVLVRLNTTYAPRGVFKQFSAEAIPDKTGNLTRIGYDAAVCLELYDPYVVEMYNSSIGDPWSIQIVSRGSEIVDFPGRKERGKTDKRKAKTLEGAGRNMNSTRLRDVFDVLHGNAINQMVKDNGRDSFYVPSATLVSYTGGSDFDSYTELSTEHYEVARGLADAGNILPYFAGSGRTVARSYTDEVLASASINPPRMIGLLVGIFLVGLFAGLFVPKLPLSVPKRGFDIYTWLTMFHGDELVGDKHWRERNEGGMDLEHVEEHMGDVSFRYNLLGHRRRVESLKLMESRPSITS